MVEWEYWALWVHFIDFMDSHKFSGRADDNGAKCSVKTARVKTVSGIRRRNGPTGVFAPSVPETVLTAGLHADSKRMQETAR